MREIQFRDAIKEAMSEEMRRDENVYLMGEEVAEYNGAYKVSQGMLDEVGPERVIDTPISELGFAGLGIGYDDLSISQNDDDALIATQNRDLAILSNVKAANLSAENFVFV